MRKTLLFLIATLVALSAAAADVEYYGLHIGSVQLNSSNTASKVTLTTALRNAGVLKGNGTVEFRKTDTGGVLTLTDAVLSNENTDGVILQGSRTALLGNNDLQTLRIVAEGNCSVTNTRSGGSAICSGSTACTGSATLEFGGSGTLTLTGGSNTGSGIYSEYRDMVTLRMDGDVKVIATGVYGVRTQREVFFSYQFNDGTFTATGSYVACLHTHNGTMTMADSRELYNPVGASFKQLPNDYLFYSMCDDEDAVKSFTVGPKRYPLSVCGVLLDEDNRFNLTNTLTANGALKNGEVNFYTNPYVLELVNAEIEYGGMAVIQNGIHSIVDGTETPGIDNLEVMAVGNAKITNTAGHYAIDNNKANMLIHLYNGAHFTINGMHGILHNMAMSTADVNPSGTYNLTVYTDTQNLGPDDHSLLTINATNGYGIDADYGKVVFKSGNVQISSTQGAIAIQDGGGVTPVVDFDYGQSPYDFYGFRNGETVRKSGTLSQLYGLDDNVALNATIGWVGKTYDLKIKGVNLTDYHRTHLSTLLGDADYVKKIEFEPALNRLTFTDMGEVAAACENENLPLIENSIDGLEIKAVGNNAIIYKGLVLRLKAPATFNAADCGNLELRSISSDGIRFTTTASSLKVASGTLSVVGATYGVTGSRIIRTANYYGTLEMGAPARFVARGATASVGPIGTLALGNASILLPGGATLKTAAGSMGVVDADGNLVKATNVVIADETFYGITVGGNRVTNLNYKDVLKDGGTVSYDPETNVLTLDNATIYSEKQGIIADVEGLKIKVKGTNLIGTVSPTYTIDFKESQGVVLEGEEGSTLSLESSQHLSGIGLFTHQHIAEPGLTIRNCDITIPERGEIQNDNNDVPLIIDNSRIYINNGYIQTAPSLKLRNCHIAQPTGGRVNVYEIVGSDGKTWEGELEIVPGIDEYPLTIAGVKVTRENKDNLTQVLTDRGSLTSGSITFDGSTLTLTDAALKTYQSSGVGAILLDGDGQVLDDLTIDVQGTCTVEDMSVAGAGLVVGGAKGNSALNATLRFTGSGTLTLAGGGHGLSAYNCNSVKLLLNGPSVTMLTSQSTDGAAISSSWLERFDYEINAGRLTATGGADGYACVNQYSNDSQTASMALASGVDFINPAAGATFGSAVHFNESGGYYLFYSVLDSDNKPVNTFTVGVPEYDLAVAGNKVTGANCGDILGDGKVVYDPEANTLTIANTTIDGGETYALFSAVEGLKVVFTGENFLVAVGKAAVRLEASATFTGNSASCAAELGGNGAINVVKGTLTVKDMAQLTATNTRDTGIGINGAIGYNESGSLAYIPNLVIDNSRVEMTGTYACLAFFNDLRLTGCKVVTEGATWSASHGGMIDSSNRLFKGTLVIEPESVALRGDVDGNRVVNGSDVTALYNFLLNGAQPAGDADVDGNGTINGSDVTALYNILLQ